ncbi:MAG: glycoside hydrolase family 2 [Herbinix sp.]|jgi:beta-galactosidase|nr:glycoside hydrolase family 2 [Herbinix sp.]
MNQQRSDSQINFIANTVFNEIKTICLQGVNENMKNHIKIIIVVGLLLIAAASFALVFKMFNKRTDKEPEADRITINLGETPWKFMKSDLDPEQAKQVDYVDSAWQNVGVPHCYNDMDTFTNTKNITMFKGTVWYRKHFTIDEKYKGQKVFLEFQGVNIGATVYVNGVFQPGITELSQPEEVTHVGGFLPFTLDVTDHLKYGEENVIAVRVSNASGTFFTWPNFGTKNDFGMGYGGIVSPVYMHITDKVHIPSNVYYPMKKWGTYVATISADDESAEIRMQTNVENEDSVAKDVTLVTQVVDADHNTVLTITETKNIQPNSIVMFDQTGTIENPILWYPNASIYGKPYLYKVQSLVQVEGETVDSYESPLGIRTITWDDDYCYINGKKHLLNGFGNRNTYPALGSAVPTELQWRDIELIAEAGGNTLRIGHVPATPETVAACDAYGILLIEISGDDEWSIHDEPANTYKREYDRDMIIRDRNHPSIAVWEANNGMANNGVNISPKSTYETVNEWDYLAPRIVHSRDKTDFKPTDSKLMIGYTNWYSKVEGSPTMNMESYGAFFSDEKLDRCIARFDYANEKDFSEWYINEWKKEIANKACGFIDWMLVETWGEGYTKYMNGVRNQKSLGSSAMDGNRIPKLKYNIWKNAVWMPYELQPGVTLQSHWNYEPGIKTVDAWSNCPSVELFLNGVSMGVKYPDEYKRCIWSGIEWESGTLKVVGYDAEGKEVCSDERVTAGEPHHIELSVQSMLTKPNGETFELTANGSDAAIIVAKVVDKDGNWCPLADNTLRFSISGPANYRGSYNFYVDETQPVNYHAPGDPELQAEGGLMKVAVRTGFTAGTVTVTATADGLEAGTATFKTVAPDNKLNASIPTFNFNGSSLGDNVEATLPEGEHNFWATYQNNTNKKQNTVFRVVLKKGEEVLSESKIEKTFEPFEEYRFEEVINIPEIQEGSNVQVNLLLGDSKDAGNLLYGEIEQRIKNVNPVISMNDTNTEPGVTNIQYQGDWGYSSNEMCYMSDNHWTSDKDKMCVLTFEGIQASYYGAPGKINGIAAISVDGGEEVMVDLYSPTLSPSTIMYTTPVLEAGIHTLTIRVTGDKHPASEYYYINIDRFDIRIR